MLGELEGACFSIQLCVIDVVRVFGSRGGKKGDGGGDGQNPYMRIQYGYYCQKI